MLNLACCTVIPSWINSKSKEVTAQRVIWGSVFFSALFYVTIGLLLALGFDIDTTSSSILAGSEC
jgi:hypothetical protein